MVEETLIYMSRLLLQLLLCSIFATLCKTLLNHNDMIRLTAIALSCRQVMMMVAVAAVMMMITTTMSDFMQIMMMDHCAMLIFLWLGSAMALCNLSNLYGS